VEAILRAALTVSTLATKSGPIARVARALKLRGIYA
jgi:hypothetical protein